MSQPEKQSIAELLPCRHRFYKACAFRWIQVSISNSFKYLQSLCSYPCYSFVETFPHSNACAVCRRETEALMDRVEGKTYTLASRTKTCVRFERQSAIWMNVPQNYADDVRCWTVNSWTDFFARGMCARFPGGTYNTSPSGGLSARTRTVSKLIVWVNCLWKFIPSQTDTPGECGSTCKRSYLLAQTSECNGNLGRVSGSITKEFQIRPQFIHHSPYQ